MNRVRRVGKKKIGLYPTVYSTGRMYVSLAERSCAAHPKSTDVVIAILNSHNMSVPKYF